MYKYLGNPSASSYSNLNLLLTSCSLAKDRCPKDFFFPTLSFAMRTAQLGKTVGARWIQRRGKRSRASFLCPPMQLLAMFTVVGSSGTVVFLRQRRTRTSTWWILPSNSLHLRMRR
ncbi:hypothetical protein TNCT_135021 [Trichonephila clavata]|uniref:Uncharacterized protein n=1 Tax=Trichonephila clavata TaxID=2740835 RepID=A0A8X6G6M1_TRICU|nr:hypothetical protein TNCT_135021 [Trichonephila clavata]